MAAFPTSTTVLDSLLFRDAFGTPRMREVFSDFSSIARYAEVEIALARAQARCGVIPADGAEEIARNTNVSALDFDLFYDRYVVLDPGGMSFEYPASASEAADELARDLLTARSELRKSGSWIRVRDERGTELYRSSIDPETPAPAPAG